MKGSDLVQALARASIRRVSGVPCSFFGDFYSRAAPGGLQYVPAANEGLAVSLAAGWALTGELPAILMQNSGLGNAVNPITSLLVPYRLGALLFVSGRAYGVADEPQHRLMGENLKAFIASCGMPALECPKDDPAELSALVEGAAQRARAQGSPVALIVTKGTFSKHVCERPAAEPSWPTRREVLTALDAALEDAVVVSTTGYTSRDLFAIHDRKRNFYMQGSMGHASSIALGIAQSGQKVVVVDGDGAALMQLGAMAMIGQHADAPICHVLIDNGIHESTGNQRVAERPVQYEAVARALGYRRIKRCTHREELAEDVKQALAVPGTSFLAVPVRVEEDVAPSRRITEELQHDDVARRVRESLCAEPPATGRGNGKR
jgi:phosphonopyruvate decarboxylase